MGILLGLSAALSWGGADFLARYAARRIGAYRTLLYMQFFGFAGLTAYLELERGPYRLAAHADGSVWAWAIAAGLLNVAASLALYRAFEIGVLALVGPIAASYPALTAALAFASGERLAVTREVGLAAALVGVILAATPRPAVEPSRTPDLPRPAGSAPLGPGVGWALAAAAGFGFMFWVLGFRVTPVMGGVMPVWIFRGLSIATLTLAARTVRQSIRLPQGEVWWLIAGCGLLDTLAMVSTNVGLTTEQVSVVTVLSSLFGAVTVGLACIFLRERLHRWQWVGIALIFVGIALVSRR
ncbi:MAG TPA: DMT family transporter [Candidatus Sulfopaludibacter sp.]|nr:DMT family transporter [Terriglobia bacterium]HEV2445962.1 DMT family transporter [Candidatus Sulfopaludibacter sp.]